MGYLKTGSAEGSNQYVVEHVGPEVPDMGVVIHRGSAAVKSDMPRPEWLKGL
jgi:hypothetical protein